MVVNITSIDRYLRIQGAILRHFASQCQSSATSSDQFRSDRYLLDFKNASARLILESEGGCFFLELISDFVVARRSIGWISAIRPMLFYTINDFSLLWRRFLVRNGRIWSLFGAYSGGQFSNACFWLGDAPALS